MRLCAAGQLHLKCPSCCLLACHPFQDHFWPPHAEAHALLARAYSLTYNRSSAALSAAPLQATLSATLLRLDVVVSGVVAQSAAANGSDASATLSQMASLLTTVQLQAKALVAASDCASGRNTSMCSAWRPLMDQALALHNAFHGESRGRRLCVVRGETVDGRCGGRARDVASAVRTAAAAMRVAWLSPGAVPSEYARSRLGHQCAA